MNKHTVKVIRAWQEYDSNKVWCDVEINGELFKEVMVINYNNEVKTKPEFYKDITAKLDTALHFYFAMKD